MPLAKEAVQVVVVLSSGLDGKVRLCTGIVTSKDMVELKSAEGGQVLPGSPVLVDIMCMSRRGMVHVSSGPMPSRVVGKLWESGMRLKSVGSRTSILWTRNCSCLRMYWYRRWLLDAGAAHINAFL